VNQILLDAEYFDLSVVDSNFEHVCRSVYLCEHLHSRVLRCRTIEVAVIELKTGIVVNRGVDRKAMFSPQLQSMSCTSHYIRPPFPVVKDENPAIAGQPLHIHEPYKPPNSPLYDVYIIQ